MRTVVLRLCAAAALLAATPAHAQKQEFSAEDLAAIDRMFGERIDNALDLCISDAAPDVAAFEVRAALHDWPPFQSIGAWRVATVPPGDSVILSLGVQVEPVTDASIPGAAFTCSLLLPAELAVMLRGHVFDKFGTGRDLGVFYLENGNLRELEDGAWPEGGIPQMFAETPPTQRLVLLTTEDAEAGVATRVTVLHRTR
jgi:hypothetical protein